MSSETASEPIFRVDDGGAFAASEHARGPWDPAAQHGGAPAALLARAIEQASPGAEMLVSRITYEFLGPVPLEPLVADARVTRPGRRLQIVEGELRHGDRVVLRARAVRLRRGGLELPDTVRARLLPGVAGTPAQASPAPFPVGSAGEPGFHRTGMEIRFAAGTAYGADAALAWFRLRRPLIGSERPTGLQRIVAAADFANGISSPLAFDDYLFVNTDLSVHVVREPIGDWVLLSSRSEIDRAGVGLSASELYDERGLVAVAAQTLYVEAR